jgi:hypothetical protein
MAFGKTKLLSGEFLSYLKNLFSWFIISEQARRFFGHLATLKPDDADIWMTLSVCCAFCEEYEESFTAITTSKRFITSAEAEIRWKFCYCKPFLSLF